MENCLEAKRKAWKPFIRSIVKLRGIDLQMSVVKKIGNVKV